MCGQLGRLRELYEQFKGRATFLFVYITEAPHALPGLGDLAVGRGPDHSSPKTRRRRIARGLEIFDLPFLCLLDEEGRAEAAYGAFPQRLVVVGTDGRIAYSERTWFQSGPFQEALRTLGDLTRR
ncbi:MAG TPA: hypothetical protein VKD72_05555 [Gemmataceae bacterium]|nr:hypothetical protein [Gemmataceae bacterium]